MSERAGNPPDIVRSAYAELIVTDLGRARAFWVDLLGFVVSAEEPDALYLRGYEEFVHHSLILADRSGHGLRPDRLPRAVRPRTSTGPSSGRARGCPTRRIPAGSTRGLGEAVRGATRSASPSSSCTTWTRWSGWSSATTCGGASASSGSIT